MFIEMFQVIKFLKKNNPIWLFPVQHVQVKRQGLNLQCRDRPLFLHHVVACECMALLLLLLLLLGLSLLSLEEGDWR